ncbi:hypothetical protein LTR91_015865 [Friedmanniomyces endolithicus]|uniref:Uncharacterized protein n=1 Tax=Friedmanniomyces endolithicus TaxID=329885 RepID=A0AAN6K9M0_9PEZI|nr:hypothetical protein LTR01_005724 [Friedmanniomyces endolithicus]KAK0823065.1 hypothetical protein LTR73_008797 [Friedmanniomyces endolithicus]KAK0970571.1 hypothetical protein LTR91_015865 [Friedmanniomyces endolithicus]KAK1031282.1 hypothetical protein LTS16_018169 [Friedmanniomyces endolithicus]
MNSTQHDELAQLFAQNMQLSYQAAQQQSHHQQEPVRIETIHQASEKQDHEPMHFISAHYTGTAHVRPDTTSEPSRSPPPPYNEDGLMPEAMAETLRQHSIDPSALLPNQVHLFANADYEQKLRLLELWRISPPSYPLEQHLRTAEWGHNTTSLEQEETKARVRYEQQQEHARGQMQMQQQRAAQHMQDMHIAEPISPIREAGDPAWPPAARMRAASIAAGRKVPAAMEAEPYMLRGYQSAVDPVYAASTAGMWQAPSYAQAMQQDQHVSSPADQFGQYEQIRNHAEWEAMNERTARERFMGMHGPVEVGGDDEMVL